MFVAVGNIQQNNKLHFSRQNSINPLGTCCLSGECNHHLLHFWDCKSLCCYITADVTNLSLFPLFHILCYSFTTFESQCSAHILHTSLSVSLLMWMTDCHGLPPLLFFLLLFPFLSSLLCFLSSSCTFSSLLLPSFPPSSSLLLLPPPSFSFLLFLFLFQLSPSPVIQRFF